MVKTATERKYDIVLLLQPCRKNSIQPWMRFVEYLMSIAELYIAETPSELAFFEKKVRTIVIPYAFFSPTNIEGKVNFVRKHLDEAFIVRYFNEYNMSDNWSFMKMWKTRPVDLLLVNHFGTPNLKYFRKKLVLNSNCLTYLPEVAKRYNGDDASNRTKNLIYYGTYRPNRAVYFRKYLTNNGDIYLSTSLKNRTKFVAGGVVGCKYLQPIDWKNHNLSRFRYSLYIEDPYTHRHYNFPANRYYECLTYAVVQVFDENCINTFRTYGIDISDFVVSNQKELLAICQEKHYCELWKRQSLWREKALEDQKQLGLSIRQAFEGKLRFY